MHPVADTRQHMQLHLVNLRTKASSVGYRNVCVWQSLADIRWH
jgi:hypothetical protein